MKIHPVGDELSMRRDRQDKYDIQFSQIFERP